MVPTGPQVCTLLAQAQNPPATYTLLNSGLMAKNKDGDLEGEHPSRAGDKPASTLLRSWGKRMAKGSALVIPVFIGGAWSVQVPRGNKRVLRVNVPAVSNKK